MALALLRIDDRLIHGQVTTAWLSSCGARRILIASDDVAKDELRKMVVKLAAPKGVVTEVTDLTRASELLKGPLSSPIEKVMVLCTSPKEALELVKRGVPITTINVGNIGGIGNMQGAKGRKQIFKSVSVGEEDVEAFRALDALGVKCEIRVVPQDRPVDVMELIKGKWEGR